MQNRYIFLSTSGRLITGNVAAMTIVTCLSLPAFAEGKISIAEQHGVSYLPLMVIRDQDLLAKHGAEQGIEIEVSWNQLGGGGAVNDALLTGSVNIAAAGVGPLLTIWDRTKGSADVKGIVAGAQFPTFLLTNNPKVQTLADLGPDDRIALPTVGVSVQARTLQYAAASEWGPDGFDKLDGLTVTLPHPEATQALISGNGTVNAHFSNSPFQELALKTEGVHKITDSYEVFGGPTTSQIIYTTDAWRAENPKTYAAFLGAFLEASDWIAAHPEEAADTFLRVSGSDLDRDLIVSILSDDAYSFDPVPKNTLPLATFMHDVGALKNRPASWKDYFFDDLHDKEGS